MDLARASDHTLQLEKCFKCKILLVNFYALGIFMSLVRSNFWEHIPKLLMRLDFSVEKLAQEQLKSCRAYSN